MRRAWQAALLFAAAASSLPARSDPVPTARQVVAAFEEICVRQAPTFRRSQLFLRRHGLTERADPRIVRDPAGAMRLRFQPVHRTAAETRPACSIEYDVADADMAVAGFQAIVERLFEDAWNRRDLRTEAGDLRTVWTVSIHGARGELSHRPTAGPDRPGLMAIAF